MGKSRLEAFSDGVIAILITIMVLEFKLPEGNDLAALQPLVPTLLAYLMSFVYLGIYWNNHHHLFQAVEEVNGAVLWANLHLLFWLSLVPLGTHWMGAEHFALWPVVTYGVMLTGPGIAYFILVQTLLRLHGSESTLATALGSDRKGRVSIVLYLAGIALAFVHPLIAVAIYAIVACIWLVPDRRIEKVMIGGTRA